MPVDRLRNLIFVHIPKTGGTSIEIALGLTRPDQFVSPTPLKYLSPENKTPQHLTWRELVKNLPAEFVRTAYSFSFVRNPWDRFVSEYLWRREWFFRIQPPQHSFYYSADDLVTLDAFTKLLRSSRPVRTNAIYGLDSHLESQLSFLTDESSRIAVDFVGRFEYFEADFARVTKRLGLPALGSIHAMRSRRNGDYRMYYSDYSREAVAKFYVQDIQAFGYTF